MIAQAITGGASEREVPWPSNSLRKLGFSPQGVFSIFLG
jgi:hypothetical protein